MNNKRHAVAAQTARRRCKVLSIQYVYYFRAYQRQRLLHGVGVIKVYFAIFAAFKESMTLNLAHRSFKVIHFGSNRNLAPSTTLYRPLIVTFALSSTVSEILPVLYARANCVSKGISK